MALNIKTIYSRNIWILMLCAAFHMLGVNVNYLGNVKCFNLCLKLCSICTLCAKIVFRFIGTVMIILNQWYNRFGDIING